MGTQDPNSTLTASSLLQALRRRYPRLSDLERKEMADDLIEEVGRRLSRGENLAFARRKKDGQVEIEIWDTYNIRRRS